MTIQDSAWASDIEIAMAQPAVRNVHHKPPTGTIYIGRPTIWGNPFIIGKDGNRATVIVLFREWVLKPEQTELRAKARIVLRGQDVSCFCAPQPCHGDIWLWVAASDSDEELLT